MVVTYENPIMFDCQHQVGYLLSVILMTIKGNPITEHKSICSPQQKAHTSLICIKHDFGFMVVSTTTSMAQKLSKNRYC